MATLLRGSLSIAEREIKERLQAYEKDLWLQHYASIYGEMYTEIEAELRQSIEAELRPKIIAELRPILAQEAETKLRATLTLEMNQQIGRMRQELLSRDM